MDILVVALHKSGKVNSATYELVEAARKIHGNPKVAVLSDQEQLAKEVAGRCSASVLSVVNAELKHFNDEIYVKVLLSLISKHKPSLVLVPATLYGKALVSRLAAQSGGGQASDVTRLTLDGERVTVIRPSHGGNIVTTVTSNTVPFFVSVRPKVYPEAAPGAGEVNAEPVDVSCFASRSSVREVRAEAGNTLTLAEADRIVSAGRGIRGPENVGVVKDLADALGAAFGSSRAVVDAGWLPYAHQVGQTGRTVNPKLYVAVGISGAIQHLVGMQSAQTIVAINKDKDAPIFKVATYGIVGDLFEIVPALTAKFRAELSK